MDPVLLEEWLTGCARPEAVTPRFVEGRIRRHNHLLDLSKQEPLYGG